MPRRAAELLVLALDIGSSSTRAALFDDKGRLVPGTGTQRKYWINYSADGAAELSPARLCRATRECLRETLRAHASSRFRKIPIAAVAGSAFWHGLLGLNRKAAPVTPIFTWADSRCARDAADLRAQFDERKIHSETGCMLRASFWPAKLRWLGRAERPLFRSVARWVSPADWIFAEIFKTSGTSESMASATGLYDRRTQSWHSALCEACKVDPGALDDISAINDGVLQRRKVHVFTAIGDGAAGNLGCGADRQGRVAINVGTSAAVRMMRQRHSARKQSAAPFGLFCYAVDADRDVIGGAISNAGNLRRWSTEQLRIVGKGEKALNRTAAATDSVTILPFWVAERAPNWPETVGGIIADLTPATTAPEIFRGIACSAFYRLAPILELVETAAGKAREIIVSGGILHSIALIQMLADALGRDVSISSYAEASLRGAAIHALEHLACEIASLPKPKLVSHDRMLAAKHRRRRERQEALERLLIR